RCALAAVLFGATTPLAAELADDLGALRLAGLLHLGAALVVAPAVLWARAVRSLTGPRRDARGPASPPSRPRHRARNAGPLAVVVVTGGLVAPVLLAAGLARTSSATAALLLTLELAATTALASILFREPVARRVTAGATLVGLAGAALVWSAPLPWVGALLVVASCGCRAVDDCAAALLDGVGPRQVALARGLLAGAVNLAAGLVVAGVPAAGPALAALAVGAAGYGVSIGLWLGATRELGPDRAAPVLAAAPFVGAAVAWGVFAEPVTTAQLALGPVVALGVALAVAPVRRPAPARTGFDPASPAFSADVLGPEDLVAWGRGDAPVDREDPAAARGTDAGDDEEVGVGAGRDTDAGVHGYLDEYDDLFDEGLVPLRRSG
ncbi:MAG TPA: DMT family transporter, partial [Acidimicrobiales bacterium]